MVLRTNRWVQVGLPVAVLVAVAGTDLALGTDVTLSVGYGIAAVVAAVLSSPRVTAAIAVAAVAAAALSGAWDDNLGSQGWLVRLLLCAALAGLAVWIAYLRGQREQALGRMALVAEVAQRAVLRTMPTEVGSVGFAARYVSATREALVGGDLYEVAETPYGVRIIVGDVRGKGLAAVHMAAAVLAGFRKAAFTQPSLVQVAADLDAVVGEVAGEEDFVTALLAETQPDHTLTLVNLGHHPPLLVLPSGFSELLDTGEPQLPLGLKLGARGTATSVRTQWPRGARILLYTDGLVETRDHAGTFVPLDAFAADLRRGDLEQALDQLLDRVTTFAGHEVTDDMAVVLAEHRSG